MKQPTLPRLRSPLANRLHAQRDKLVWRWHTRLQSPLKRGLDLVLVVPALFLLAPLFAIVALAIRLYDRGPALFWQERVGLHGRVFRFPKFRSMCVNAESMRQALAPPDRSAWYSARQARPAVA